MHRLLACSLLLLSPLAAGCSQLFAPDARDLSVPEESEPTWVALSKPCPADAPAYGVPAGLLATPPSDRPQSPDDRWAALARRVPGGLGGIFYEDGQLVMVLVDPAQREQAIAALEQLLDPMRDARLLDELPTTRVKQGRWDFGQLHDWYAFLHQAPLPAGQTFSEITVRQNRITFGVKDEETRQKATQVLDGLDIPCYLVALQIRGYAMPAR